MAGLGLLTLDLQEEKMAHITIKDLSENVELDRQAMQSIAGGSRWRGQAGAIGRTPARGQRIVDFKTGAAGAAARQGTQNKAAK
jgi:RecB family exonuclease